MTSRQKYTQAQVIAALRETKGMVYLAAKRLGCEAQTIYNYRDRYPAVRAEMEQQDGEVDDAAEMKLYQAIIAAGAVDAGIVTGGHRQDGVCGAGGCGGGAGGCGGDGW